MTTKLTARVALALLAVSASATLCLLAMSNTEPIVDPSKNTSVTDAPDGVPFVNIGSVQGGSGSGPLTHVYLGNELSCQVAHIADPALEFFPSNTIPGDCGTFIALGGTLYAPDFSAHGGTATGGLGARVVFTPISQTAVSGGGTAANPYKTVAVVGVGTTGLSIQQTDSYIVGDQFYRTDVVIMNNGGPAIGLLYRAGDAFLAGSDHGFGFTTVIGNRKSVGCSINPNNVPLGKIEEYIPLTGGNNYYQSGFNSVWSWIATKTPFPNTCLCTTDVDNGAGISWNFNITAGGSATFSHLTNFGPGGTQPLLTSKTADSPTSMAGSQNGYTITIENPNPNPVTLSSITDTLPAGFSYVSGTSAGVTTNNPAVSGQLLTWTGPFVVAPGSSISLHFRVVGSIVGDFFNQAGGQATQGYTVMTTGPTARITVTPCGTPTPSPCPGLIFGENFDAVVAPALPPGWVATNTTGSAPLWVTSTTAPHTVPIDAFVNDPTTISNKSLDTPGILITSASTQLCFRNNYNLESGYDGGVLEISTNGGAFSDIISAGGSFITGGYNATISSFYMNPISGRRAWSGNSGGYICSVVRLPASANGQTIRLRFRMGSDNSIAGGGWRIDTIQVAPVASNCCCQVIGTTRLGNVSTRLRVETGENIGIGGVIITGSAPKHVLIRAIGPSLSGLGVPGALQDPVLELHGPGAFVTITNNNWRDTDEAKIQSSGIPPANDLESAIDATLEPGAYTAVVRGNNNTTGVGLVETYDLDDPEAPSTLGNISTRALVGTAENVVIAGFLVFHGYYDTIILRGIGPSLTAFGIAGALADPTLELRDGNGALLIANNDWQDDPAQAADITASGLAPTNQLESGIAAIVPPGLYTAVLAGRNNGTGVGLIEVYDLDAL